MVVKGKFESNQSKGLFGGFSGKKLYFEESFHGNTGFLAFSKESFLSQWEVAWKLSVASQETPSGLLDDKSKGSLAGGRGFY